ncbi:DnaJ domain-containing protein [Lysobacter korlensis]|uniref:DnaJ domain-containing protein n=1 Tax=Lysobacter korlensis TaxID=553636 RepID=A0ABV6RXH1_9GAMM
MSDSPISATPYEILGVSSTAPHEEIRRAYRRLLRATHPDVGGDATRFIAVQKAWERIATPEDRAAYDRGQRPAEEHHTWAPTPPPRRPDTRPSARSYGHPGGWRRERYLTLIREWAGRGADLPDPFDPALVRSAPRELRHLLADALAEEATARTLSGLGIGFTLWHDVATDPSGPGNRKIDHVVLGPTGLFALQSEDFGGPVRVKRGELVGEAVADERPMRELEARAKALSRAVRAKFTGLVIVLPDDAAPESYLELGTSRGATTAITTQSFLPTLLRNGIPGSRPIGGNELFDLRTRLQAGIRFV